MSLDHPLVLLGFGALLGFLSSLGGQALNRRWSRQDRREDREYAEAAARRAEIDRRVDGAAQTAVDAVERFRDLYRDRDSYKCSDHPDHATRAEPVRQLHDAVLLIRGPARAPLQELVGLLSDVPRIEETFGSYPQEVVGTLCDWGRNLAGALLRAEPLPDEPPFIEIYRATDEVWRYEQKEKWRAAAAEGMYQAHRVADENANTGEGEPAQRD